MDQESSTRNQSTNQQTDRCCRFRLVWIVYLINTGYVFYYCFNNPLHVEYLKTALNKTLPVCYGKVEKKTFPILINVLLGLLGTIISSFVHCLCNFFEKLVQSTVSRKCQNVCQLLKSCFSSGILWGGACLAGLLIIIGLIAYFLATGIPFNDGHQMFIFGGCSISNLVTWWLRLDKQTPNEETNYLYPAYTLAWDYFLNDLQPALLISNQVFIDSNIPVQEVDFQGQGTVEDAQSKIWLNLKKMIILISPNCIAEHDLQPHDLDNEIDFIHDVRRGKYCFSVYRLNYKGKQWTYVIEYVQRPLETLKLMCCAEFIKNLHEDQFEAQVELFFNTLVSEILSRNSMSANSCIPILTMAEPGSLENGGLVKIIMEKVEPYCTTRRKIQENVTADTSQTSSSHIIDIPTYVLVEQSSSDENTVLLQIPSNQQIKKRRRPVNTRSREVHDRRPATKDNLLVTEPISDGEQLSSHYLMYNSDQTTSENYHAKSPATNYNLPVNEPTGDGEQRSTNDEGRQLMYNSDNTTSRTDHAKRPAATNDNPPVTAPTGNGQQLSSCYLMMNNIPSKKVHNRPAIPPVSDSTEYSAQKPLTEDQDVVDPTTL